MRLITKAELAKALESAKTVGKSGSRKEAKARIKFLIDSFRSEQAKLPADKKAEGFVLEPKDVNGFEQGFTEGLLKEIAIDFKIKVLPCEEVKIKTLRNGEEITAPRFAYAIVSGIQ